MLVMRDTRTPLDPAMWNPEGVGNRILREILQYARDMRLPSGAGFIDNADRAASHANAPKLGRSGSDREGSLVDRHNPASTGPEQQGRANGD
jgi:hypothetical protein